MGAFPLGAHRGPALPQISRTFCDDSGTFALGALTAQELKLWADLPDLPSFGLTSYHRPR